MRDIRIDNQKNNLRPYFYGMFSLVVFIFFSVFAMAFFRGQPIPRSLYLLNVFKNRGLFPLFSQILIQSCFSVFSAVLFSKIFIKDFHKWQNEGLFITSRNRNKIVRKKIGFVSFLVIAVTFFSTVISLGALLLSSTYLSLFSESKLLLSWPTILSGAFLSGIVAIMIGMISLAIGFKRKTPILTILVSLIMCSVIGNIMQIENEFLNKTLFGLLLLGFIGAVISVVSQVKQIKSNKS